VLALAASPPGLVAESATIDRGELKAGAPFAQEFKLTNRSPNQSVKIVGLKVSCGCSKHAFAKDSIAPGETIKLNVQLNTLAQPTGPWSWTAEIRYRTGDASLEEMLPLRLQGKLFRELTLTPPGLAFSLENGSISQDIVIADSRPTPLTIRSAASSARFVEVKLHPGEKPGQTRLTVTAVAKLTQPGEYREAIVLTTTDPVYPELHVPVTVSTKHARTVKAYPAEVDFQFDQSGTSGTQLIQLRRPDGLFVQIEGCEIENGNIAVSWSKDKNAVATVSLKFSESLARTATTGKAELRVKLKEPAGELLTIPVTWR
jgi:Protein of unknown function (DUF1573)